MRTYVTRVAWVFVWIVIVVAILFSDYAVSFAERAWEKMKWRKVT